MIKPAYTVAEVSAMLGLSRWTVVRLFENEPGRIRLPRPATMNKGRYRSLRIPHAVYMRVLGRLSQ
jgi:hypothetical protein